MKDSKDVPGWHAIVIGVLMIAQIVCGALAWDASSDTNRDIFFAQQIASGTAFPLTGPEINFMLHLGPLWYYILAIPLLIVPNAAAVTAWAATISSVQFPLAYELGRRYATSRTGLLFALLLALPGYMVVPFAMITHVILAVPALLFATLIAIRYRENPVATNAVYLGIAGTLMLTAHPTLILPGIMLTCWAAVRTPSWRLRIAHAALVVTPVLLSLVPMIYEQWRDGFTDLAATTTYAHNAWTFPSPIRGVKLLYAIIVNGPRYVMRFWLDLPAATARVLFAVYAALILAAVFGLALRVSRDKEHRRLIVVLIVAMCAQATFLCAIRDGMPPWMIYSVFVFIAALGAMGLDWLCARNMAARVLIAAGLVVTTSWTFAVYAYLDSGPLQISEIAHAPGKGGWLDIRDYEKSRYVYRVARVPFHQLYAIGAPLCEPVALFGPYAFIVDYTFAVSALAQCGSTQAVQFGGVPEPPRRALLGLNIPVWEKIGMKPQRTIGVFGFASPQSIWHSPVAFDAVVPRLTNYSRKLPLDNRTFTVAGDADGRDAVLVSSRTNHYAPFRVVGARANGVAVEPVYDDLTTVIFRAQSQSAERVHWEIDIDAVPDYIDVLTFASQDN